jgi:hypothetical protein
MTLSLQAVSIGCGVHRRDYIATIHSVFKEVVNLKFEKGRRLLTVVTISCPDLPQGIRIDTPPGFSFLNLLHPTERMLCTESILRDEYGYLAIDLRMAERWKYRIPFINMKAPETAQKWLIVRNTLEEQQNRTNAQIRLAELFRPSSRQSRTASRMGELTRSLVEATRLYKLTDKETLAGLIGLGSGLTPAGDDLLVGFQAGLRCNIGDDEERWNFVSHLGKLVVHLSSQTTDISCTYLYHAAHGRFSSSLTNFIESISREDETNQLLYVAKAVMEIGNSSGMDALTGLLIGLAVWEKGILPN